MANPPDEGLSGVAAGTRTARSKFLEAVKSASEASHLELVVEYDSPNSGYGCVQKPDGFSNYYAFHFDFGNQFAVFFLGTSSVETAGPDQRRQVDYKDGKEMDLVLQEIRQKIGEATREAFPQLKALSSVRTEPVGPSEVKPKVPSSGNTDAAVWGQDLETLNASRYRRMRMPRRGHATIISLVIILLVVVLTLAPVLGSNDGITDCYNASCETSASYYQSVSFREIGVGGVYIPHNNSSGSLGGGTIQAMNGTNESGIELYQFYIAW